MELRLASQDCSLLQQLGSLFVARLDVGYWGWFNLAKAHVIAMCEEDLVQSNRLLVLGEHGGVVEA